MDFRRVFLTYLEAPKSILVKNLEIDRILLNLKGAAAPPAAGPFNSALHTGDPFLGLNVFCFIS